MKEILAGKVPLFLTQDKALKRIQQERARGDLGKARRTAVEALEKWPEDYDVAMEAAQACIDLSDYPQAANILKNAHKRHGSRRKEILDYAQSAFLQSFSTLLGSFVVETLLRSRNLEAIASLLQTSPESFIGELTKRGETRSRNLAAEGQDRTALHAENELLLGILYRESRQFEKAAASLGYALEILAADAQAIGAILVQIEQEIPENVLVKFYIGLASSLLAHPEKAETRFFQCLDMEAPPLDKILAAIESASDPHENRDLLRGEILLRSGAVAEGAAAIRASLWGASADAPGEAAAPTTNDARMELAERRLAALPEKLFAAPEVLFLYCDVADALGLAKEPVAALEKAAAANAGAIPAIAAWLEKHGRTAATAPAQNLLATVYLDGGDIERGMNAARRAADLNSLLLPRIIERVRARTDASPDADPKLGTLLCELYARAGDRESAEEIFGSLRRRGALSDEALVALSGEIMRHCGVFLTGVVASLDLGLRNRKIEEAIPYVVALYREKPECHDEFAASIGGLAEGCDERWAPIAGLVDFMAKDEDLSQPFRVLQASAHLFAGEIERAVFEFDQLTMRDPDLRGRLATLYTKALTRFDGNAMLHLALYHLHLDEESFAEAAHHLCRTFEIDPNQIRDVVARFEKLVEREPGNSGIYEEMLKSSLATNRTGLAREILARADASLPPDRRAALHVYGAKIAAAEGKWDETLRFVALALSSADADVRTIEVDLRAIRQRDPSNPQAHFLLGETLLRLGRENEALDSFRRCLDLSGAFRKEIRETLERLIPLSIKPWLISGLLGELLWLDGATDDALRCLSTAQQGPRESRAQRGSSIERLRAAAPDDTRLALLSARNLSLETRDAECVSILEGLVARDESLVREAADILVSIVAERPAQCDANRLLARVLARAGDVAESRRAVIRIMSDETADPAAIDVIVAEFLPLHETNAEFLLSYGGCKARRGEMAEALARYRASFEADPARPTAVREAVEKRTWPNELLDATRLLVADCLIAERRPDEAFTRLAACAARDGGAADAIMARLAKLAGEAPRREHFSFGASLLALAGRVEDAESFIAKGLAVLGADDALDLTIELAEILDGAGDAEKAQRLFAAALETSHAAPVLKRIERAYVRRTDMEMRNLTACFDEGRAGEGETVRLAGLLLESGSPERALEILSRSALSGVARSTLLGRIYLGLDRPTLACAALAAADAAGSASDGERCAHRYLEGIARERAGDYGRAAAAFAAIAGERGAHADSRERAERAYTRFLESCLDERPMVLEKTDAL